MKRNEKGGTNQRNKHTRREQDQPNTMFVVNGKKRNGIGSTSQQNVEKNVTPNTNTVNYYFCCNWTGKKTHSITIFVVIRCIRYYK